MKPKQNPVADSLPLSLDLVKRRIYVIRGREIMLDSDLAELYQVHTKRLNESVRRNKNRFPQDFMFALDKNEVENLRFQFETSNNNPLGSQIASLNMRSQIATASKRNTRFRPYAFTEHGVAMLSSILKSKRAIQMNIFIIRAFIELRKMLASHEQISRRLQKVEGKINLYGQVLTGAIGFEYRPKSKQ
jgi:hypothetical protein